MNCKPTPSQKEQCYFWHATHERCTDTAEYVNRETGEPMCRYNDSAVHVSEYRKISADSGAGEHISQHDKVQNEKGVE